MPLGVPHLLNQALSRHHDAGVASEHRDNVELFSCEFDRLTVDRHLPRHQVNLHSLRLELGLWFGGQRPGSPRHRLDACEQLAHIVRFHHEVIGAGAQPLDAILHVATGRCDDNGHSGLCADSAAEIDAIDVGKPEVEQHHLSV